MRYAANKVNEYHQQVAHLIGRSNLIQFVAFNLTDISDKQCLEEYCFLKKNVVMLTSLIRWNGLTNRNEYKCNPITATWFILQKLGSFVRWSDLEEKYGKFKSQMSEVFWEQIELLMNKYRNVLNLLEELLRSKAKIYTNAIQEVGASLDQWVGFIDCTKIKICLSGGHNSMQRFVYFGHKRFHSLIYQFLKTIDVLIFDFFGPKACRRNDLNLFRNRQWSSILEQHLCINNKYYYIYEAQSVYCNRGCLVLSLTGCARLNSESSIMQWARYVCRWSINTKP